MIYQRHIPREELFSAQLELLMQNNRMAMASIHLIGVIASVAMFWAYVDFNVVLLSLMLVGDEVSTEGIS